MLKKDPSPTRRKNILYATHRENVIGGGEISLFELIRELDPKKFQAFLAAPAGREMQNRALATGACLFFMKFPKLGLGRIFSAFTALLRLTTLLYRHKIKIIHANTSRAMIYCGPAGLLAGIPVVWHVRITDKDPWLDWILFYLAEIIVCNSRATASRFEAFGHQEKIRVIYNGLDLKKFTGPFYGKFFKNIPEGCPLVLNVGRLEPEKGQELFIEIAKQVKKRYPSARFVLAGKDIAPGQQYLMLLQQKTRELDMQGEIIFAGESENVPEVLAEAAILVSTSGNESFGRALLEAAASGIPAVAFEVGGVPEVVEEGKTGFLVKAGDTRTMAEKILLLLSNPALQRQMGSRGREKVQKDFTSALHAQKMQEVYETLS